MRDRIDPKLGASLDVARALAAIYVVIHHVAQSRGWTSGSGVLLRFGQEAVLVFFLLSGFVIFANEKTRALAPRGYYLRRIRRIYPLVLAAMLVSAAISLDNGDFLERFSWSSLIGTLLFLQDISSLKPGVIIDPFLGNSPLWSLSYEMAFYLAFPSVLIAWTKHPRVTQNMIGAVCCCAYISYLILPNHFSQITTYFLVWWCGAMAADSYMNEGTNNRGVYDAMSWLAALCVISAASIAIIGYNGFGLYPFLQFRHFLVGLLIMIVTRTHIAHFLNKTPTLLVLPGHFCASISFGIYVLHYPILVNWQRSETIGGLALGIILLILSSYIFDRKLPTYLPRAPKD